MGNKKTAHDCSIPEGPQLAPLLRASPRVTDKRLFPALERLPWHPNPYSSDL